MRESFEGHHESGSHVRTAIMAILLSLAPTYAKAELPECHTIGSRPVLTESVRLEDGEEATVVCVVDGDTFDVQLKDGRILRIRLWGVDCPETYRSHDGSPLSQSEKKRGEEAKELAKRLLKGKKVILKGRFANKKKRKQAYVSLDGKDLGIILIGSSPCLCVAKYHHKLEKEYGKAAQDCKK